MYDTSTIHWAYVLYSIIREQFITSLLRPKDLFIYYILNCLSALAELFSQSDANPWFSKYLLFPSKKYGDHDIYVILIVNTT